MPILRFGRGEPVMPAPKNEPELTRSENIHKDYVEWYTSRNPARPKQRQHLFESAPPSEEPLEGESFVGMAILHDEEKDSEKDGKKRSRSTRPGTNNAFVGAT